MASKAAKIKRTKRAKRTYSATQIQEIRNVVYTADTRRVIDRAQERAAQQNSAYFDTVKGRAERLGISPQFAKRQEAGHELGLLANAERLGKGHQRNNDMLNAGLYFSEVFEKWQKAKGIPSPNPRAADIERVPGKNREADDPNATERALRAYNELVTPILSKHGRGCYEILKRVCVEDERTNNWPPNMFDLLIKGLGVVEMRLRGQ